MSHATGTGARDSQLSPPPSAQSWAPPRSPLSYRLAKLVNDLGVSTPMPATHTPLQLLSPSPATYTLSSEFLRMNKQPYGRELKNEVVVQAPNDGFQPYESLELGHINEFEFTQPRTDPAFVPAPHSSARILVYQFADGFLRCDRLTLTMRDYYKSMSAEDSISALVKSRELRTTLLKVHENFGDWIWPNNPQLSSDLGVADDPKLRDALREDEGRIATHILSILDSESSKETALDRGLPLERDHSARARRIILKLSEGCDKLPSSSFITGVTGRDEHATFGGGFGDIYRATYAGKTVALKHVRTFHRDADLRRIRLSDGILQQFCREALAWQHLRHPYILPLIGIDRDSFPPSLCVVSPWMEHGTVLKYLNDHGRANVDRLLSEIAQGLEYLHSRKIVHGDLRGVIIKMHSSIGTDRLRRLRWCCRGYILHKLKGGRLRHSE
ncbi:hypothetical protein C8J57DRAFT_1607675 [Mycena rebaudengoi]|nr:hypothetical protein C8J57DRAFT_1607675 [Mycena rebaudengoi]